MKLHDTLPLFSLQEDPKEIPLSKGKVALVDASDYDFLMQWKWHARKGAHTWYAQHNEPIVDGKQTYVFMHVAILGEKGVDHVNGDGCDNRRSNLRLATTQQNNRNARPRVGGSSAFKGVTWDKQRKKWMTRIGFDGKSIFLGYFDDETEAARAYDARARELFGEFARLNFPEVQP